MSDPFHLERFVDAQASTYEAARAELAAGSKRTHWMWFVFPQMKGLGSSHNALFYGIGSREEARAYLAHPVLGPRLVECAMLVLAVRGRTPAEILGSPDDLKLLSSMTLFAAVAPPEQRVFADVLAAHYGGRRDEATLRLLEGS